MAQPSFSLYAELLINIRQISVLASLDTPCDSSTKIKLSDDGQQFFLFHNGQENSLELPGKCYTNFRLQEPSLGSKELSWRLPWVDQKATDLDPLSPETPWSAKFMSSSKELSCRACGEIILKRENIKTWKDLPSEDWAEMMELWHCHKPNDDGDQCNPSNCADRLDAKAKGTSSKNTLIDRAYGANSRFFAQPGIGLIDIMNFLLTEADCKNIRIEKFVIEVGIKKVALLFASAFHSLVIDTNTLHQNLPLLCESISLQAYPLLLNCGSVMTSKGLTQFLAQICAALEISMDHEANFE
ncbi:hypothetical protein Golomagni_00832 [Golovinomyces magnicellulatus]|nr:hypothetical protein Golomagni_00832 [Golovinomyces magnicellulatus]